MNHSREKGSKVDDTIERRAGTLFRRTGSVATLASLSCAGGSGASAAPRPRAALLALTAFLTVTALLLSAALASAKVEHNFKASFGTGQLSLSSVPLVEHGTVGRSGLAVDDTTHNLYVADTENHRVVEFSAAGTFIRAFGADVGGPGIDVCTTGCAAGTSTSSPGGFESPTLIAVDNSTGPSEGDVYVADAAARLVSKFDSEGHLITTWGTAGQLNGSVATGGPFTVIDGIAVDDSGRLLVYDGAETTHNWFTFAQNGTAEPTIKVERESFPSGIAVDNSGHLFKVVGFGNVTEYASNGVQIGDVDGSSSDSGLAIDRADNSIYVDVNGLEIQHFASSCASTDAPQRCPVLDSFGQAQLSEGGGLAVDSDGTVYVAETANSVIEAFEPVIIPDTTTEPATALEQHIATLNGHVDPAGGGEVTSCRFAYVEAVHFEPNAVNPYASGQTHACSPAAPYAAAEDVSAALTGLASDTTYHFRLEAANANATFDTGEDQTFTTTGPPLVKEEHATDVEPTTATLSAIVNPSGYPTNYHFRYGKTTSYGSTTTSTSLPGSAHADEAVSAAISALEPGTTYHFDLVAESECEPIADPGHICETAGPDQTFESLPPVSIRDFATQTVAPEEVALKAELDNNNSLDAGHWKICIGPDAGHYAECREGALKAGSGEFEAVGATFTGLRPDTTYHYQLTAHNSYPGEVKTADATFTTERSAAAEHAAEAAECPNITLREEDLSTALPDCRAYEQVSPSFKAASAAFGAELSPGGERAAFGSTGTFAGIAEDTVTNFYYAYRTATGWLTQSAEPSRPEAGFQGGQVVASSAELDRWLIPVRKGVTSLDDIESPQEVYYLGTADGAFRPATPVIAPLSGRTRINADPVIAESADLSHIFLASSDRLLPEDPRGDSPETSANKDRIYEVSGVGGTAPSLSLAAELPAGLTGYRTPGAGGCSLSVSDNNHTEIALGSSSTDGSGLFYTSPLEVEAGGPCPQSGSETPNKSALFFRSGTAPPVQVSVSRCHSPEPCASAPLAEVAFDGASPDASLAWFTSAQPLIDSDVDSTKDLYLAKLENGHVSQLVQASAGETVGGHTAGQGADVQGVLEVSPDGTHVAFVATGVLTETSNAADQRAVAGADNLYVYDAGSGQTKFVSRLCSGPEKSGSVSDAACPASLSGGAVQGGENDFQLWAQVLHEPQVQFTPDGGNLLFDSYGRLASDDTDKVQDVYRYDFQTGSLVRVSVGRDGNDADGNDNAYPATIPSYLTAAASSSLAGPDVAAGDPSRSISADGSRVIFTTAAPLVSNDTNAAAEPGCAKGQTGCDVYEWEQQGHGSCRESGGCVGLVSSGHEPEGASGAVLSSSGRDVTFVTSSGLLPADTDGLGDLYDAREGGGFPSNPPPAPCGGNETCHHESSPAPSPPKITTENQSAGNGSKSSECAKGKVKRKKHGQVRCVAKKHSHPKRKHAKPESHHQRAGHNRGGRK